MYDTVGKAAIRFAFNTRVVATGARSVSGSASRRWRLAWRSIWPTRNVPEG